MSACACVSRAVVRRKNQKSLQHTDSSAGAQAQKEKQFSGRQRKETVSIAERATESEDKRKGSAHSRGQRDSEAECNSVSEIQAPQKRFAHSHADCDAISNAGANAIGWGHSIRYGYPSGRRASRRKKERRARYRPSGSRR